MVLNIKGRLTGLNEYTASCRTNRYAGAKLKKTNQDLICYEIMAQKLKPIQNYPISLNITWYEPNSKRDIDNITFATKFILDALVEMKIIKDDSQKYVNKINHEIVVDRNNAHIKVEIIEDYGNLY